MSKSYSINITNFEGSFVIIDTDDWKKILKVLAESNKVYEFDKQGAKIIIEDKKNANS